MGVKGLTTFFNQNPDFLKPYRLHNSFVIFDGDNLIHALYYNNKVSTIYGGDYKKYADGVRRYFCTFLECKIKPIIIFDGGYDISGRKLKTIFERAKTRLQQVKYISNSTSYHERILPIFARDVFISILVELDIIFAMCDYEADDQITALANYYKCPVISADSDFFIYDVHKGFIRLDSIDTTINIDIDSDGIDYKYLSCNIFHIDEFICCFPGIDKKVLPLFGALIGNDYVEGKQFDNFFSNIQLPKYNDRKLILNFKQKKMIGLLCWLKNYTLNEAVNHVMQYLKKHEREYVKSLLENAVNDYDLSNSNLSYVIDKKLYNFKQELHFTSRLTTPCNNPLPLHFIVKFHSGQYHSASFLINALVLHKLFLLPQIEDISLASIYECSHFIRKVIYGILIRHDIDNNECQNEKCLAPIEEIERSGNRFQKKLVEPIFSLKGIGMLPKINELNNLKEEEYILIITNVLGVNSEYFLNLPYEWQLLFGCFNYWLRNCQPHCTESFIYALVINLIYFSIIKSNSCKTDQFECSNKKPMEVQCTCPSIICTISKICKSELESAEKKLKKYGLLPSVNHGNPLLMYIMHSYSQLQGCIKAIVSLNKLLGEYMISPAPHKSFSGTMLYNLTKDISSRLNAELFVAEILGRETTLHILFSALISRIYLNVPSNCIGKNQLPFKTHKKKPDSVSKNIKPTLKNFDVLSRTEFL